MKLKQLQSQMLSAIFSLSSFDENSDKNNEVEETTMANLHLYQRNLLVNASRALAITFATVHSFLGQSLFNYMVKRFLQTRPKAHYDWGELGQDFPGFIGEQAVEHSALLSAIATLDFACHQAERAENVDSELQSLALLNDNDAYQLTLNFAAGFRVLRLAYPVDVVIGEINKAAEQSSDFGILDIKQKAGKYQAGEFYFVIWRPHFQAHYKTISQEEYHWLTQWQQAKINQARLSLGDAMDRVDNEKFSIVDWLPKAIKLQLINSVIKLSQADNPIDIDPP